MEAVKKISYTTDDIYSLSDGERAELIDGTMYYMAPPSAAHQRLLADLMYEIESCFRSHNGSCQVYPAPFAVFLNADDKNYVEPDISVICDCSKVDDRGCIGAPDWVIEIVSPSSRSMDYYKKLFKYRSAGVREYWIADPEKKRIVVYNFEHNAMEEYSIEDKIPIGICEGDFVKIKREIPAGQQEEGMV